MAQRVEKNKMKSYKRIFTEVDNTKSKNVAIRVYRKTFEDYYNKEVKL